MTQPGNEAAGTSAVVEQTADAVGLAIEWIRENRGTVRESATRLERDFRKLRSTARQLREALARPMCVGVFGPSQAGKSYLISTLARWASEPVYAVFGDRTLNFVSEINPEGGQESTGIVTRFTVKRRETPAGYPVALRLLSELDVVKIIANSYLSDFNLSEEAPITEERLDAVVDAAERSAASVPAGTLNEDQIYDLQEYFDRYFRGAPTLRHVGGRFWERVASLLPRLPVDGRAAIVGLLWGEIPELTQLYRRLTSALEKIGHADEAFCPISALVPRERSIIDVQTLGGLGRAGSDPVEVVTLSGRAVALDRSEITALIAELTISLRDSPWPFFEHTDLLDFPGARSRENIAGPADYVKQVDKLPGLFLRGKVAYLYQRYCAEQELTSMLLCIREGNQEVRTLPGMVKEWIDISHGREAADRSQNQNALFLVLTRFDKEFEEKAGQAESSDSRWTIRLNASFLDFFGKAHGWPHEWTPGRPFDNVFWLRNPNAIAKHIIDYDDRGLEIGIRSGERVRIDRMRSEYLSNEAVRRHFADPARAWDEALRLNDGGISYLAERLTPVCNPLIKVRQVHRRVGEVRRLLAERLVPFYVDQDIEAELDKRRRQARDVAMVVAEAAENQLFGRFLSMLYVQLDELHDIGRQIEDGALAPAERTPKGSGSPAAAPIGKRVDTRRLIGDIFGDLEPAAAPPAPLAQPADQAELLAGRAVAAWASRIQALATDGDRLSAIGLPRAAIGQLAVELVTGATRLGIAARITDQIRPSLVFRQKSVVIPVKALLVALETINDYVNHLGFGWVTPDRRPKAGPDGRRAFHARPAVDGLPPLGSEPSAYEVDFYVDWITCLRQLVEDNVRFRDGSLVDSAANEALGRILRMTADKR